MLSPDSKKINKYIINRKTVTGNTITIFPFKYNQTFRLKEPIEELFKVNFHFCLPPYMFVMYCSIQQKVVRTKPQKDGLINQVL